MALLIDTCSNTVRLTSDEMKLLRRCAAKNGYAVNKISTLGEATKANIDALPLNLAEDMLEFFETGTSTFTSCGSPEELQKLLREAE
jgi:hypothetical protein